MITGIQQKNEITLFKQYYFVKNLNTKGTIEYNSVSYNQPHTFDDIIHALLYCIDFEQPDGYYFDNKTSTLYIFEHFVFDCSTIGNPELYISTVVSNLKLNEIMCYRHPFVQRDASKIDFINFVPHIIRNYKVPILYFVDNFVSFKQNNLWKNCRKNFKDIVVDRNANIELLSNI